MATIKKRGRVFTIRTFFCLNNGFLGMNYGSIILIV